MLNIVIFSGGTGSIALQKGFYALYGDTITLDIIINAYDNGKSTGACRKICGNAILGPSDLRKNQLTKFELIHAENIKDHNSREYALQKLFSLRFSCASVDEYMRQSEHILENASYLEKSHINYLKHLLSVFRTQYKLHIGDNNTISFEDFSLSNIFYAACAVENASLRKAGTEMAKILHIPDSVHLISDIPLFLHAITSSGYLIEDEGDIVCWNNAEDKIKNIFCTSLEGKNYIPTIDENNTHEITCKKLLENADIIIFSSGTQWSSLIPTYIHKGVRETIKASSAKKYCIMNNCEDGDMYGVSANEIYSVLSSFLDVEDIYFLINKNAQDGLNHLTGSHKVISGEFSKRGEKKHTGIKIAGALMQNYFSIHPQYHHFFDLDGTLYQKSTNTVQEKICSENLSLFPGDIITGNNYAHVKEVLQRYCNRKDAFKIYFDFGNSIAEDKYFTTLEYLTDKFFINDNLVTVLNAYDEYRGKIEKRGNVVITIKPLSHREAHIKNIQTILSPFNGKYIAFISGFTSIDIVRATYNKAESLKIILQKRNIDRNKAVFIGNELQQGNEYCIYTTGITCVHVRDIFECNNYIHTYRYSKNRG